MKPTQLIIIALVIITGVAFLAKRTQRHTLPAIKLDSPRPIVPQAEQKPMPSESITHEVQAPTPQAPAPPPDITIPPFPKGMEAQMGPFKKKYDEQFASETNARKAMHALIGCLSKADALSKDKILGNPKNEIPKDMKNQIDDLPHQLQASCLLTGKKLVERYPSLKGDFAHVLSRATPKARDIFAGHR